MHLTLIGDVHGCFQSFLALLAQVEHFKNNRIILLGDLINKGPASYSVFEWARNRQVEFIIGNHEYLCIHRRKSRFRQLWQRSGSFETKQSVKKSLEIEQEKDVELILTQMSYFFGNRGKYTISVPTFYGTTILLTHAGISEVLLKKYWGNWKEALEHPYSEPASIVFSKAPLATLPKTSQVIGHQPKLFGPIKERENYYLDSGCVYTSKAGMGYLSALVFDLIEPRPPQIFRQKNIDRL